MIAASPALRAGLAALLAAQEINVIGAAAAFPSLEPRIAEQADVFVVEDVPLTGLRELLDPARTQGALLLGDDPGARIAELDRLRALPLAGWGWLESAVTGEALRNALRAVASGLVVLTPEHAPHVLRAMRPARDEAEDPALTAREREVLELAARGLPSKAIAGALGVSESTVKFHLSAIYAKLGAASRTEAVSRAAQLGLITL